MHATRKKMINLLNLFDLQKGYLNTLKNEELFELGNKVGAWKYKPIEIQQKLKV